MSALLTGLTIGKGALDFFGGLFSSNSRNKKLQQVMDSLKQKEDELMRIGQQREMETKRGAVTSAFNAVNDLAPSNANYLNPAIRNFATARVGAQAHQAGLQAKYQMEDKAQELSMKRIGLEAEKEDFDWMGSLADSATEVAGGLMAIDQLEEAKKNNEVWRSSLPKTTTGDNVSGGIVNGLSAGNKWLGNLKGIPEDIESDTPLKKVFQLTAGFNKPKPKYTPEIVKKDRYKGR
jgi:hypothetical protein